MILLDVTSYGMYSTRACRSYVCGLARLSVLADDASQRQGLNPADAGGQVRFSPDHPLMQLNRPFVLKYDSNGGVTLQGNPIGSQCLGCVVPNVIRRFYF